MTYEDAPSLARFSVARYQRMIEAGILTPDDKVELLENYIVLRLLRTPRHDGTIQFMMETLLAHRRSGWLLRVLQTLELPDSQPEPDFSFVRGTPRSYLVRHPSAADTGLVIEVADSSLLRDQRDKTRIYARAEIPFTGSSILST